MSDSITSLDSSPILWKAPSITNDITSSYVSAAKFFQFTGTKTDVTRIIDGIGQVVECTYTFATQQDQFNFLKFFEDRKASYHKFWLPIWSSTFKLDQPVYNGNDKIYITPSYFSQGYQGYERVWFLLKDGSKIVRKIIDAKDLEDKEELTLDTALDRDITMDDIEIFGRFILARFGENEIEFEYKTTYYAQAQVKFYELVAEYDGYNAEANQFAELYKLEFPNNIYYYTSFYRDIEFNYQIYSAVPMRRSRIESNINTFNDNRVEVVSRPTKALREYVSNSTLLNVKVTIYKLDIISGSSKVIFIGTGGGIALKDEFISLSLTPVSSIFNFKIPKVIYQPFCNNILFDKTCGLHKENFQLYTTVTVNSDGSLQSDDFASKPDGWFTGGFALYGEEYRLITNHVGNKIYLQVSFNEDVNSKKIYAYPGCDGSPSTCKNKFNNLDNFVGFPYIPSKNPVVWGIK